MTDIIVRGTQTFRGIEVPVVYGGFGENQKCVTARSIADVHGRELKHINRNINRLIEKGRFIKNLDYINLLDGTKSQRDLAQVLNMATNNRTLYAFILSERGYIKLAKYMKDEISWQVIEDFSDTYFNTIPTLKESSTVTLDNQLSLSNTSSFKQEQQYLQGVVGYLQDISMQLPNIMSYISALSTHQLPIIKKTYNNILDKDAFVTLMEDWKKMQEYNDQLNQLFSIYCDGHLFQPDCSVGLLRTLEVMFNDIPPNGGWIEHFTCELDFGKKYTEGMVTESDGSPIPLGTIEELYDLLIKEMNNNGK